MSAELRHTGHVFQTRYIQVLAHYKFKRKLRYLITWPFVESLVNLLSTSVKFGDIKGFDRSENTL